jgi:hypothetical protein
VKMSECVLTKDSLCWRAFGEIRVP